MIRETLLNFTDTQLIIIAMLIFMVIFVVNMIILFMQTNTQELKYYSKLPLEEGVTNE